jgi:hypothetical protein
MGLLDRIRRGTYAIDASAPTVAAGAMLSLADVARRVAAGAEPLGATRDLLDQAGRADHRELVALIAERPELTGTRVDALLAGVAEHLAATRDIPCPAWVHDPERFLDSFWFVSETAGFRAVALAQSPMALKRRGILWPARSLERV